MFNSIALAMYLAFSPMVIDASVDVPVVSEVVETPTEIAAPLPDIEKDPIGFGGKLLEAGKSKDYRVLVIGIITAVIFGLRFVGKKGWVKWFATDRGGATLAVATGILTQAVLVASAGASFGIWPIIEGVINGVTAAGGVVVLKRLFNPKDAVTVIE